MKRNIVLAILVTLSTIGWTKNEVPEDFKFVAPNVYNKQNISSDLQRGLIVYDSLDQAFWGYSSGSWVPLSEPSNGYVESLVTSGTTWPTSTSGNYVDLASITITKGDWEISAGVTVNNSGANSVTDFLCGISFISGSSAPPDQLMGDNTFRVQHTGTSGVYNSCWIPSYRTGTGFSSSTIFLKGQANGLISNFSYYARISARRIR